MTKSEFNFIKKNNNLKPWKYQYYKFMYRLGHSEEFENVLLHTFLILSISISSVFLLLIIFDL